MLKTKSDTCRNKMASILDTGTSTGTGTSTDTNQQPYNESTESQDQQGCRPFLDTLTSQGPDGTLITMVYRKQMHTGQYLHWDSHHSIINKHSIYNTISHRAQYVCSNHQLLKQENQHIPTAVADAIIPDGCSIDSKPNWNSTLVRINGITTQTHIGKVTETKTPS